MSTNWCTPLPRDVGVVVVAAGRSVRFGGSVPKQYLELAGTPILLHALRPFTSHPDVAQVVVVLRPDDAGSPPEWLAALRSEVLVVVPGGATRMESVAAGLAALREECTVVLVHDGARPFPPREVIDEGITVARRGGSAVPALPVAETIKRADDFGRIIGSVPRQGLWLAQTPQAFPRELLVRAHQAARSTEVVATDDAMLVELLGAHVDLIPGSPRNLKITTANDLALAMLYLGSG
jgi:2-C-methyl-D-erythritol 4-phosphate cytidylyltransferase